MPIRIPPDHRPPPRVLGDLRVCEFIAADCGACGHAGDVDLRELVDRHGPWLPLAALARRLRCRCCGGWPAGPPRIVSSTPRWANHISYHDWLHILRRGAAAPGLPPAARPLTLGRPQETGATGGDSP